MAKLINLGRVRKDRARRAKRAEADENAVRFGRSKAKKELEKAQADKARADLDGHEREE